MKTDRELLELAAKAAGGIAWDSTGLSSIFIYHRDGGTYTWSPLTDDGDAMRLAVRLQISISQNIIRVEASTIALVLAGVKTHEDTLNQDWNVATRRAIVRAAAAIGEAMP